MKTKIFNFFKSDLFKKCLMHIFYCFVSFLCLAFLFGFLINCIYFAIKLVEVVPVPQDLLDVFSRLIFS